MLFFRKIFWDISVCFLRIIGNNKRDKLIVKEKTMKNLSMKTLITAIACIGLFGIVRADETTTTGVSVSGEFSTDITFGDATTFVSPYTGMTLVATDGL